MSCHITLEPHAGSHIGGISTDAQRVADLLGVQVEFRFNDVRCIAVPNGSADTLTKAFNSQVARTLEHPRDTRFASSRVDPNPVGP